MFAVGLNTETILVQSTEQAPNVDVATMLLMNRSEFDPALHRPVLIISEAAAFLLAGLFSIIENGANVFPLPLEQ